MTGTTVAQMQLFLKHLDPRLNELNVRRQGIYLIAAFLGWQIACSWLPKPPCGNCCVLGSDLSSVDCSGSNDSGSNDSSSDLMLDLNVGIANSAGAPLTLPPTAAE